MSNEYGKGEPDADGAFAEMAAQCARVREMAVRQSRKGEDHAKRVVMEAWRNRKKLILTNLEAEPAPVFRGSKAFDVPLPPEVRETPASRPEPDILPKPVKAKSSFWPWS